MALELFVNDNNNGIEMNVDSNIQDLSLGQTVVKEAIKELYKCIYDETTFDQITEAIASGKFPYLVNGSSTYWLVEDYADYIGEYNFEFTDTMGHVHFACCSGEGWRSGTVTPLFADQKVTELNDQSTDNEVPSAKCVYDELNEKQDTLTFDNTPTENSNNPVTSDGIYDAIASKTDVMVFKGDANIETLPTVITLREGKTAKDVKNAIDAHKDVYIEFTPRDSENPIIFRFSGSVRATTSADEYSIVYQFVSTHDAPLYTVISTMSPTDNYIVELSYKKYMLGAFPVDIIGLSLNKSTVESTKNKVSLISVSSTDIEYPSAKSVYDALQTKQNTLTFDSTPTENSSNPVTSDGIYDALQTKQNTLTFDSTPTDESSNPVTSDGIYDAIETAKELIPTKTSNLANDGADGTSTYVEANDLATVATSGAYSDLTGQPTKLSDFNNDVGFITSAPVSSVDGKTGAVNILPSGGNAGQVLKKNSATNYDVHWANETEIYPSGYCTTAGGTATKVVNCSLWTATPNTYLHILIAQANSYADAITMKINASSPIPVYINGDPSSTTNYSLPGGSYIAFYDGTNIYLRTDGQLPGNIIGEAAGTEAKLATKADSAGASANYYAKGTASIPYGECNNTSTSTAFTASVPGITELKNGVCVYLRNNVVTSAANCTLNINGLGAKPLYSSMAAASRSTTIFNINYTMLFIFNENRVSGGCWDVFYGYDSNTNTIGYQVRTNSQSLPMTSIVYRYRLLFTSADRQHYVPANNSTSTNATASRAVCQDAIDPFGAIYYYGTTASVAAGSRPSAANLWQQYTFTFGYSFNRTGAALTLTAWKPIYIKCAPQADGSAIIDDTTPYVQDLPITDDGKIYIHIGIAYNETAVELTLNHPVYYHDGSGIRLWTGQRIPSGLPTVSSVDNGKVLQVVNGAWAAATIPNANGVNF